MAEPAACRRLSGGLHRRHPVKIRDGAVGYGCAHRPTGQPAHRPTVKSGDAVNLVLCAD
jgi:hypothetical protein